MIIEARFGAESLVFTGRDEILREIYAYRDYPEIFGHPRFLMADFDEAEALVRDAIRKLAGRWQVIAPRINVLIDRPMPGGLTPMDRRILCEIFTHGGAREVILKTPDQSPQRRR